MCCVTKNTPQLSDLSIFSSHSFAGSLRVTGLSPDPGWAWCRSRPQVWLPGGADHTELLGVPMHQGPSSSGDQRLAWAHSCQDDGGSTGDKGKHSRSSKLRLRTETPSFLPHPTGQHKSMADPRVTRQGHTLCLQ